MFEEKIRKTMKEKTIQDVKEVLVPLLNDSINSII